eukprot:540209-Pleurochrysis_carterae.AAC.1
MRAISYMKQATYFRTSAHTIEVSSSEPSQSADMGSSVGKQQPTSILKKRTVIATPNAKLKKQAWHARSK